MSKREFKSNGANSSSSSSSSSKKSRLFPGDIPTGNPNELASALLRWLPEDATMKTKSSKDLLRAFDLVKAKLQHRTNLMAESNVEEGGRIELILCGIAIPPDVFRTILSFVSPPQTGSLVAKNWLAATRLPHFWHTLDAEHSLLYQSMTVRNMTDLLNLLSRPQFSSLRVLVPPDKVQIRAKALEQIAKACPNLEEFDLGFSLWSSMKVDDKALLALPELFPHLKGVRFGTHRVTVSGMVQFCEKMGDRLISLRISDSFLKDRKISDPNFINSIARHCSSLEHFEICAYSNFQLPVFDTEIIALLNGCTNLKHLSLVNLPTIGKAVFQHIAENNCESISTSASLSRLYVVNNTFLKKLSGLCFNLRKTIESFELVDRRDHNGGVYNKRLSNQLHHNY